MRGSSNCTSATRGTRLGSISVGCNNTCTSDRAALRGKEVERRPGGSWPSRMLVPTGVQEITLLGQNVNADGGDFGDSSAFYKLLRAAARARLERVRSPRPSKDSPRGDRGHGGDAEREAVVTCRCSGSDPCWAMRGTTARPLSGHHRPGRAACRRRRSPPTSSSAFTGDGGDSRARWTWSPRPLCRCCTSVIIREGRQPRHAGQVPRRWCRSARAVGRAGRGDRVAGEPGSLGARGGDVRPGEGRRTPRRPYVGPRQGNGWSNAFRGSPARPVGTSPSGGNLRRPDHLNADAGCSTSSARGREAGPTQSRPDRDHGQFGCPPSDAGALQPNGLRSLEVVGEEL